MRLGGGAKPEVGAWPGATVGESPGVAAEAGSRRAVVARRRSGAEVEPGARIGEKPGARVGVKKRDLQRAKEVKKQQ